MLLTWKGGDYDVKLTDAQIPCVIVATGAAWGRVMAIFLVPWVYRVVIKRTESSTSVDRFPSHGLARLGFGEIYHRERRRLTKVDRRSDLNNLPN